MKGDGSETALARIEAALARIEAASDILAEKSAPIRSADQADLARKHEAMRSDVAATLVQLDALIDGLEE